MGVGEGEGERRPGNNMDQARWRAFYAGACPDSMPGWDTAGRPASQLVALAETSQTPLRPGTTCVELACGTGSNGAWLAARGCDVVGIDFAEEALKMAAARRPGGNLARWVNRDILALGRMQPEESRAEVGIPPGGCDFVFDLQCFHVLRTLDERLAVRAVWNLLRPGGLALVVVGNAGEPARSPGPAVLTREELLVPFTAAVAPHELAAEAGQGMAPETGHGAAAESIQGMAPAAETCHDTASTADYGSPCSDDGGPLFSLEWIEKCRFDPTPAYGEQPPLAWKALFRRL